MNRKITYSIINIIILSTISFVACSNRIDENNIEVTKKVVKLQWKLSNNDTIFYKTVMSEIGESSFEADFGGIFKKDTNSTKTGVNKLGNDFFKKLKDQYNNTNLVTRLTKSPDFNAVVDIEMIAEQKDKKEVNGKDEARSFMSSMMKGTMLRGSVNTDGSLHSFWMKNSQKNLLSLFFELPNKPIKKGDTWTLHNVNFIGNDQNFVCRKAKKENTITLTDIKEINGETIAIINYNIIEFVSGDFKMPKYFGSSGKNKTTEMEFVYKAQAEFSINKGKWINYNGIMSLNASGMMNSVQKKKFALIEE